MERVVRSQCLLFRLLLNCIRNLSRVIHVYKYDFDWHRGKMSAQPKDIPNELLAIRNTRRHFFMQTMTRHDLNAYLGLLIVKKVLKLRHVIEHKGVLSKLNFNENVALNEVNLLESTGYF